MSLGMYVLVDGLPTPEPDVILWGRWIESHRAERIIAQTNVGGVRVSTVFLALDQNFYTEGPPLLWETMIFGGRHDQYQARYSTRAEAEAGHLDAVAYAQEGKA